MLAVDNNTDNTISLYKVSTSTGALTAWELCVEQNRHQEENALRTPAELTSPRLD
jgi:hypothetical protein